MPPPQFSTQRCVPIPTGNGRHRCQPLAAARLGAGGQCEGRTPVCYSAYAFALRLAWREACRASPTDQHSKRAAGSNYSTAEARDPCKREHRARRVIVGMQQHSCDTV